MSTRFGSCVGHSANPIVLETQLEVIDYWCFWITSNRNCFVPEKMFYSYFLFSNVTYFILLVLGIPGTLIFFLLHSYPTHYTQP